jgi:hypothetical protein
VSVKLATAWLIVIGAILAAYLLISDRTLSPSQLAQVRTVCTQCHSNVPAYDKAVTVHDIHSTFTCNRCHADTGLNTAVDIHHGFEWAGIMIGALSLGGILTNFIIVNRKKRTE